MRVSGFSIGSSGPRTAHSWRRAALSAFSSLALAFTLLPLAAGAHTVTPPPTTTGSGGSTTPTCQEDNFDPQAQHTPGPPTTAFPPSGSTVKIGDAVGATYYDEAGLATTDHVINTIQVHAPIFTLTNTSTHAVTNVPYVFAFTTGGPDIKERVVAKITGTIPTVGAGTYDVFLQAWDMDQNAKPDCGVSIWTLTVSAPPPPANGTLSAVIYDCLNGAQTTTVDAGALAYSGGSISGGATAPPVVSASVPAGTYTVLATAGTGQMLVACGSNAGVSSQSVAVPSNGTGSAVFYESPIPPLQGTLTAVIYACNNGSPTTTPAPGSVTYAGSSGGTAAVPPALSHVVTPGVFTVTATAGSGQQLVACGSTAGISSQSMTVPTDGTAGAVFYEQPIPEERGTLTAVIYACNNGSPTTTPAIGSVTYSGSSGGTASVPPALSQVVSPGAFTVTATAGSGQQLVACGSTAGVSSQSVTVPNSGTAGAVFYERAIPAPPDCDGDHDSSNAATDVDCHNPPALDCDGDHDNSQSVTGEPATCQNPAGTPDCDGDSDNTPAASCPPGTLVATVYLCDANGSPTTTVEPGTFSVTPGTTLTEGIPASVTAGSYVVTATAGSGFALVACHGPTGPQTAVVPSGGTATLAFYESQLSSGTLAASVSQPNTGVGGNAPLTLAAAALLIGFGILVASIGWQPRRIRA